MRSLRGFFILKEISREMRDCSHMQERAPNKAVVAESVVAIVTRKGNPKNVTEWNDLTR